MNVRDGFFALLVTVLTVLAYLIVQPFVTYVLAAVLLAFLLYPLQRRYASRFGPRTTALGLLAVAVAVLLVPVGLVVLALGNIATSNVTDRPVLRQVERLAGRFGVSIDVPSDAAGLGEQFVQLFAGQLTEVVGATVNAFIGLTLFVFLLYYFLVDGAQFVGWIRDLTPLPPDVQDELYAEANRITWAVIEGHVLVGLVQGLLGGLGLFVAGVPNAALWTLVMVLFAFVPVVGVAAVWLPATVYLLVAGRFLAAGFLFAYSATVISWIDNYLRAFLVDRGADLHPSVVLVGVVGGLFVMGPLGLFFGPIVLALYKAVLLVVDDYYSL
ncbi:AI-2E family transporter [Halomicrococcus sp. NG-SE-24]|uniref:AI-2E family transporter n=1 Tax=Halomicrococcus sp. NG-SE-24 TaxID=3436928 RepID=UPI003D96C580